MSNLYLTNNAADAEVTSGSGTKWAIAAVSGNSPITIVKQTVAGNTIPLQLTDGTSTTDGTVVSWYTPPLEAVTISGAITASLWARESNSSANVTVTIRIEEAGPDGSVSSTIVSNTVVQEHSPSIELGTGENPHILDIDAASVTDTTVEAGNRLRITLWIDDPSNQGGFGNMGATHYAHVWINGATDEQGQSEISFTEALVFQTPTVAKIGSMPTFGTPEGPYAGHTWAGSGIQVATDRAADGGSAVETARISITRSETGSGVDARSALAASLTRTDTGTAVETSSIVVSRSGVDTGSSVENTSTAAARTLTDVGSGTDVASLAASRTVPDAVTAVDSSTTTASLTSADDVSVSDQGFPSTSGSLPDVGESEEESSLAVSLSGIESGSALDAGQPGPPGSDSSTAVESSTLVVSIVSNDAANGLETGGVGNELSQKSSTDDGLVAEASSLLVTRTLTESGSGSEGSTTAAALFSPDVITPLDNFVSLEITLSEEEIGSVEDDGSLSPAQLGSDDGALTDDHQLLVTVMSNDTGSSVEASTVPNSALVGEDLAPVTDAQTTAATLASSDTGDSSEGAVLARSIQDGDQTDFTEANSTASSLLTTETATAVESSSLLVTLGSSDEGGSEDDTQTDLPSQPRSDGDTGTFAESEGEVGLSQPPSLTNIPFPSFVEVLQQVRTRENGSLKVVWAPVANSPALRFWCRFDLSVPPPGKEGLPPAQKGVVLDRIGLMMCDVWVGESLKAGHRVRCLTGPIQGTFDVRNIPEQAMGYNRAHHLEVGVIEVAQTTVGTNVSTATPLVPSMMRHLYASRVEVLRNISTRASGSTTERWEKISDVVDARLGIPGEMMCRMDLQFRRVGRDILPPITAGVVQDRVGTLVCDPTANLKAGDRIRCTAGDISGTFTINYVPDLAPDLLSVHHLEVQIIEVAQSLQGVQT